MIERSQTYTAGGVSEWDLWISNLVSCQTSAIATKHSELPNEITLELGFQRIMPFFRHLIDSNANLGNKRCKC